HPGHPVHAAGLGPGPARPDAPARARAAARGRRSQRIPVSAAEPSEGKLFRMQQWTPDSWRALPAEQQPDWPAAAALARARPPVREVPPLVFAGEARNLTEALAAVTE